MALIKLNDRAVSNATTFGSISSLGEMKFISKATASSSASIEFTLGDYKEYQFYFVNIHPQNNQPDFQFNFSTDSGSNYNVIKTTTTFYAIHSENDVTTALGYNSSFDLAQSTSYQGLVGSLGNTNDESVSGIFRLFNPSSNIYVKHYITENQYYNNNTYSQIYYGAGYANTTSALTNIKFQMSSGNIDAGSILMFGIN